MEKELSSFTKDEIISSIKNILSESVIEELLQNLNTEKETTKSELIRIGDEICNKLGVEKFPYWSLYKAEDAPHESSICSLDVLDLKDFDIEIEEDQYETLEKMFNEFIELIKKIRDTEWDYDTCADLYPGESIIEFYIKGGKFDTEQRD